MAKGDKRSSRFNNRTLDTFFILSDNMPNVIAAIRADEKLSSLDLNPPTSGASQYKAVLKIGDGSIDIVTLMLSGGDRYLGCFDPRFKSEEYEKIYGGEILDIYTRLSRIFSDNSKPEVREYLEKTRFATDSPPTP